MTSIIRGVKEKRYTRARYALRCTRIPKCVFQKLKNVSSDDEPCPSVLIMGTIEAVMYHTVIAVRIDYIRVITVYIPEENKWIEYRRRRTEP